MALSLDEFGVELATVIGRANHPSAPGGRVEADNI